MHITLFMKLTGDTLTLLVSSSTLRSWNIYKLLINYCGINSRHFFETFTPIHMKTFCYFNMWATKKQTFGTFEFWTSIITQSSPMRSDACKKTSLQTLRVSVYGPKTTQLNVKKVLSFHSPRTSGLYEGRTCTQHLSVEHRRRWDAKEHKQGRRRRKQRVTWRSSCLGSVGASGKSAGAPLQEENMSVFLSNSGVVLPSSSEEEDAEHRGSARSHQHLSNNRLTTPSVYVTTSDPKTSRQKERWLTGEGDEPSSFIQHPLSHNNFMKKR